MTASRTAFLSGLFALLVALPLTARALDILVPAYFYPDPDPANSDWDELQAAAGQVGLTAIMNPSNGPGAAVDPNYTTAVNALRAAGGRVIGYVHTSYGARDPNLVKADIDAYAGMYNVDGIFLDEMSNQPGDLAYYQDLRDYIANNHPAFRVVGNPGIHTLEGYLATADSLVTFENDTGYPGYVPDAWTASHPASRFVHLMYDVADAATMRQYIDLAVARNVGYVYVTDDAGGNPWDTLPGYWEQEVAYVAGINARAASARAVPGPSGGWLLGLVPLMAFGAGGRLPGRRR